MSLRSIRKVRQVRWSSAAAELSQQPINEEMMFKPSDMRPRETVTELDKFVVGQGDAKKAVAIALRNRWRRHQVPEEMREEVFPKNILMIGPTGMYLINLPITILKYDLCYFHTGVGKTEIARRLAKLTDAPFVKVEATKFTEVGYHGRDVDTIIDDLLKNAISITKNKIRAKNQKLARKIAEDKVLEALAGKDEMETFRSHLGEGALDDMDITIDLTEKLPGPKMQLSEGMISFKKKTT